MSFTKVYCRDTVTSTMDVAREYALAGEKSDTVVTARFQTAGRGRQQRTWFAPHGANVCMTVIGRRVAMNEAWQLALVAGVSVAEALDSALSAPVNVRFPNDIYVSGKKLGGILIETIPHEEKGYVTPLVGIGVNVNIPGDDFPEDLRTRMTSILAETGKESSLGIMTALICRCLDRNWDAFQRGPLETAILPKWRARCVPDSFRTFEVDGLALRCQVIDLAGDGLLTIESEDGARHRIHAAQVVLGDD